MQETGRRYRSVSLDTAHRYPDLAQRLDVAWHQAGRHDSLMPITLRMDAFHAMRFPLR